jgi:hypothetical protein
MRGRTLGRVWNHSSRRAPDSCHGGAQSPKDQLRRPFGLRLAGFRILLNWNQVAVARNSKTVNGPARPYIEQLSPANKCVIYDAEVLTRTVYADRRWTLGHVFSVTARAAAHAYSFELAVPLPTSSQKHVGLRVVSNDNIRRAAKTERCREVAVPNWPTANGAPGRETDDERTRADDDKANGQHDEPCRDLRERPLPFRHEEESAHADDNRAALHERCTSGFRHGIGVTNNRSSCRSCCRRSSCLRVA